MPVQATHAPVEDEVQNEPDPRVADWKAMEHDFIGPTWQRNAEGGWLLPEHTLGWEIAAWCAAYLRAPDGGPWKFTLEQLRFVLWWYAIDRKGRFVYRIGVLQRMKGWGKDPLLAVLCLVELCGPSRLAGWRNNKPVGQAHPAALVQIAAVNQSQTENTMALMPSLMSAKFKDTYGLTAASIGLTKIRAREGRLILEAVTSNPRSLEGRRTTFTVLNETHHWVRSNKGHKMYETIDGNATKVKGRYLAITNAFLPGEDSVAENMRNAFELIDSGKSKDIRFLYDSVEAHANATLDPECLRIVIPIIRGDAVWLDPESIIDSILNPAIPLSRSRRMWLNQIVADEDALVGPETWKPLEDEDAILLPGDEITLGFDGGKSDDSTALVALRIRDRCAFVLGLWEKPEGPAADGWQVNRARVSGAVHNAFATYKVHAFFADVALWESYLDDWAEQYGDSLTTKATGDHAIAWDMRSSIQRVTRAHERLLTAIFDGKLKHDGDAGLRRHVLNARRRENKHGVSFGKESADSPRKVDLYAALMLAHEALHDFRTRGSKKKERSGRGYFF